MYSNIQDTDEGTRRNLQLETRTHVFSSAQLLEALSLSRSRPWIPDMGVFTGIRDSELRVGCFTPRFSKYASAPLRRPKGTAWYGRIDLICGIPQWVSMSALLQSWLVPDAQCCVPAFLPPTFAMYFVTLAPAFNMESSSSGNPNAQYS